METSKLKTAINSTSQKTNISDYGVDSQASACRNFLIPHLHVILGFFCLS
jgi:hypothetical protein